MAYSSTAGTWQGEAVRRSGEALRSTCRDWNRRRWTGFEIAVMVLGFIVFWPLGLAILLWILWKKRHGEDIAMPHWMSNFTSPAAPRSSGNRAFEEWKAAELARLEEERRKLFEAQREFEEFLEQLKHAKDKEEFDRFMASRQKPAS